MNYIVKPFTTDKNGKPQSWAVWNQKANSFVTGFGTVYKFMADEQAERLNAKLRQAGE